MPADLYHNLYYKRYSGRTCQGFASDEYVCCRYSDKDHNVLEAISNFDKLLRKDDILQYAQKYKTKAT